MVGHPLGDQEFPLIPRVPFDQLVRLQTALIGASLISTPLGEPPLGWEGSQYSVLRLNPLLRPRVRISLPSALLFELDRWTVAWAADKMNFFSMEWLDQSKRAQATVFLEYAWPLFAIAIWIARRDSRDSSDLLAAVDRAWSVGWWPRDFDPISLFGDIAPLKDGYEQSEFDRLWERAVSLQLQGDFEEARNVLFLAIESVGGEAGGYPYYLAHYRLGTLCLDLNDLVGAAKHLTIAEGGAVHNFVAPDTLAHICYEQALLARRRGREDRAQERFKSSIAQAQKLGLNNLLCLNFHELACYELELMPAMSLDGHSDMDVIFTRNTHIAQAEIYLRSARAAVERIREPTPEEGALLLLEARILAAKSQVPEAKEKALAALAAYRQWDDRRTNVVVDFLHLLNDGAVS